MTDLVLAARAFAETRHAGQTRKDTAGSPYITHPQEVALLTARFGGDVTAICAAWLHDTVEDCPPTSVTELEAAFGSDIAGIVGELSDDKSLPKAERKRQQVSNAPHKSPAACLVKIADKCANCRSMLEAPPTGWDDARRRAYIDWAKQVVAGLRHCPPEAVAHFHEIVARADNEIGG